MSLRRQILPVWVLINQRLTNMTDGGEGYFCSTSDFQNYWTDLQNQNNVPKTSTISLIKPNVIDFMVTKCVTDQVKIKMFQDFATFGFVVHYILP